MCGIAGFLNLDGQTTPADPHLPGMIAMLRHRGPDGYGYHTAQGVGLAHARLSIIDLEGGSQPLSNEDGTVWVTFNGEIFNYIELREELRARGHRFATQSDTEVLVHAYEEYGLEFVHRLNGQFAFAIWDERAHRLLLVRDRVGILPLFHARQGDRVIFGSEIKALLPATGRPARLSAGALDELLTFWSPLSPHTMFPGISELPPGHLLVAENRSVRTVRYWDWDFPTEGAHTNRDPRELAEELRELLIDATRLRLRADVPVGAYLSGGLDSSILTTIIKRHTGTPLRTFSIGFEDSGLDETRYQQELIDRLEADHSRIRCGSDDVAEGLERAVWHTEAVVTRAACVPMMLLSGLVHRRNYRVVLTGEGADEVFGGYDIFKEAKIRQFWARNPDSTMRPSLLRRLYPYLEISPSRSNAYAEAFFRPGLDAPSSPFFAHLPRWTTTARCKEFFSPELRSELGRDAVARLEATLPAHFDRWHWLNRSQYVECRSLLAGYLLCSQGDRMLMANSVEGRFPFLDHRVIAFARRLPPTLLMKGLNEKYLLKQAMGAELPAAIVKRPKQPYRAPGVPSFLQGRSGEQARELLSRPTIRAYGYFDDTKTERLVRKIDSGRIVGEKDNMALVAILSTQLLHRAFVATNRATSEDAGLHAAAHSPIHSH